MEGRGERKGARKGGYRLNRLFGRAELSPVDRSNRKRFAQVGFAFQLRTGQCARGPGVCGIRLKAGGISIIVS